MSTISIVVEGPDKSGKGHVISAITHVLELFGCNVNVQLAETHNAPKLLKTNGELATRLQGVNVRITEMQTR